MSSSIESSPCIEARVRWGVPRIVLVISISTYPFSLFAEAPLGTENADNAMSLEASEQLMVSATKTVAIDQSIPEAEPVMVSRDLEVLEAAVGVSQSGLDLEKDTSESPEMIGSGRVAIQAGPNQLAVLTSGLMRVGGQHGSDSTSAFTASDAGDPGLTGASHEVPGEPVAKVGGISVQRKSQDAIPHIADASQNVDAGLLQHIPIAVFLAVIALIALIPVSRRGVTHTDLSRMSQKNHPHPQNVRLGWR